MLQALFIFLLALSFVFCQYQIVFDPKFSPPIIVPFDIEDYIYSVPLNQMMSRPIEAAIQFSNGTQVTSGPLSSATFIIFSKDAHGYSAPDRWAATGGQLCQKAAWWLRAPERFDRNLYKTRCGSPFSKSALIMEAYKGKISLDWLYHKHHFPPRNKRILIILLPEKGIYATSNPFLVSAPAHHLTITQQPPKTVFANNDFTVIVEIHSENGTVIDKGLDSVANVDITIPYYYKTFRNTKSQRMLLKSVPYRLAGENRILHQGNYDWIIRKQAVKGRVVFDKIRILDPGKNLKLNITITMPRTPWQRIPNCETCYADLTSRIISEDGTEITYPEPDSLLLKKLRSVALTTPFEVKEQKLHKLHFTKETIESLNKLRDPVTGLIPLTRNVHVPEEFIVTARDHSGRRIYSGSNSEFDLSYKTIPASVCISSDTSSKFYGGQMALILTICQIIDNVTIEIIPSLTANGSIFTPAFKVDGELTIAHFGDFSFSGDGTQVQSHVNSFIRFAALDINNGNMIPYFSKEGFRIKIKTLDTESNSHLAYKYVMDFQRKTLPKHRPMLIITSSTSEITRAINQELEQLEAALISTSNTDVDFSDKKNYPLFNRLCWSDLVTYKSLLQVCQARAWTKIILVKESSIHLTRKYRHETYRNGITIVTVVDINTNAIRPGEISHFKFEMGIIKSTGIKIILLLSTKNMQPYIFRAAQLSNIDSLHGYQWILYSFYAWQFPFANEGLCNDGVPCTKAFASTYLISETYNITGYHTKDWVRVLGYHFAVDRFNYKGGRVKYRPPEVGAKMALGYDSVLLYANVIAKLVSKRETITADKIAKFSRNLRVTGLTGDYQLDENGDRIGFFGFVAQINPLNIESRSAPISMVVKFIRSLIKRGEKSQLEIPYKSQRPGTDPKNPISKAISPIISKYNVRTYLSVSGIVDQLSQTVTQNPSEPWPSIPYTRNEKIAPMFSCDFDCGKNILSPGDINTYDTGRCDMSGRCVCNSGFHGNFCQKISCMCEYGKCISASHCQCFHGWRGLECNIAICNRCNHGECIKPDTCVCGSKLWIGKACDTHIAIVMAPLFVGGAILIGIITLVIKYVLKHAERNAALSNNEWIVEWPYVTQYVSEDVTTSRTSLGDVSTLISQKDINTFIWKNEKWYGKALNSKTIDPKIPEMRLEMVELVKLRHRNLIIYGGACLTVPNVCLFLEVADKGSLNDILLNDSIDLGWEFKFSFLKDICAGMKYLHERTTVGSHGRLKSHNCLIDSRWTVRISGFGAHTIRYGRFRLQPEEKNIKQLFWTAPELLESITSLDDVKNGTVNGDTYSFAIVITEVLTRAEPYDYELGFISEKAIYDMITDTESRERKAAQKIWGEIGGASMFNCRPIIKDEYLPESGLQKKQFLKMLDDAWNENPSGRPNFDKLSVILNQIHPAKGELIDNLIQLLESYSTNLEMIVVERTKELEVNKARAEQLLSQMLPRKVTAELKLGHKIPPEIFPTSTVFFSDIVDFGRICQESSPFQIVDFLNETYNAFDEVLDTYDVYKVETISDSYMVVSGVPECNGMKHASEICTMALDLMSTVTTFLIPHKPKATLQLRIGIHSGPVVAGVVGMLMPRYCLFGDTVNTASRMESSSQALHIQISDTTAGILEEMGGFELESRGQREVKGRGLMTTYWLWGKEDFNKPMPDQSLALSLSQHKFK